MPLLCAAVLLLATAPSAQAELSAWGSNTEDALCDGHTSAEQPYSAKYVKSSELAPSAIAGGEGFVIFVAAGKVYACGSGLWGTLGREGTAPSPTALEVALPEAAVQVAAGQHLALALTSGGAVYEWGDANPSPKPHRVGTIVANSITAGPDWAAASLENGSVVTWGSVQSQYCTPSHYEEPQPRELYGAHEVAQVAAAMEDLYMLTRSGEALSCGPNDAGSLGSGAEGYERGVFHVTGLTGAREIAATRLTGYAVGGAGELFEWGWPVGDVPVTADPIVWPLGGIATARENVQVLTTAPGTTAGQSSWGSEANLAGFNPPAEAGGPGSTLTATVTVVGPGYFDDYVGAGGTPAPKSRGVYAPAATPPAEGAISAPVAGSTTSTAAVAPSQLEAPKAKTTKPSARRGSRRRRACRARKGAHKCKAARRRHKRQGKRRHTRGHRPRRRAGR